VDGEAKNSRVKQASCPTKTLQVYFTIPPVWNTFGYGKFEIRKCNDDGGHQIFNKTKIKHKKCLRKSVNVAGTETYLIGKCSAGPNVRSRERRDKHHTVTHDEHTSFGKLTESKHYCGQAKAQDLTAKQDRRPRYIYIYPLKPWKPSTRRPFSTVQTNYAQVDSNTKQAWQ
jgi:hypothetical protein